ncbi:hypothetical protein CLU83_4337 [Flavobacterium sp. 1]|uniref:hypothetical protein n=1 Tax=Flavobacterium sp. 1 TaxID=2035200 RepID=UPI000C23DBF4|nr:hypothetical protein [Flavobacterium sp. 1]PJJ10863.1 hypothetical protein CLU83_4337 [Flavobacterium sp. 1]
MKSKFLYLLLLVSSFGFSQSINDYTGVIIPLKYDFLKSENQYRLATLTKVNLKKAGFEAFYSNETFPGGYNDRCSLLNVDVIRDNAFLVTKLYVVFKDCSGKEIFKSQVGKSKEKDYEVAYSEALNMAFESVYALHYKYDGTPAVNSANTAVATPAVASVAVPVTVAAVAVNVPSSSTEPDGSVLFAQPIKNGFQLVDSTPKVVLKAFKTTNPSIYLASKGDLQGTLVLKDNQWYFEYYEKDTLMSEKIKVKF